MHRRRHILLALRWYHPKIHRGVFRYACEAGWHLNASMAHSRLPARGWQGDGVITTAGSVAIYGERQHDGARWNGIPTVELGRHVANDDSAILDLAVDHFQKRGFRSAAFCGPFFSRESLRYDEFLRRRGRFRLAEGTDLICPEAMADWVDRQAWFVRKLTGAPKPLAVLAIDDDWGAELIEAALSCGIRVPDEVAILGVRNDEMVCEALSIPLSSIENNLDGVGYEAAALLDRHLDGEPLPARTLLVPPLGVVSRQSTDILAVPHARVARALRFIREHFRERIGVADVARHAGMSERGLYQAFRVHLRCAIGDEILRVRMQAAESLIVNTDMKLSAIAEACGFGEPRNFYNAFRRQRHASPREWRQHRTHATPVRKGRENRSAACLDAPPNLS